MSYQMIPVAEIPQLRSARIAAMEGLTRRLNGAGVRRTLLFTNVAASLRETVGEPREIRRAKAFCYHLEHVDLPVYDEDLLIGSITGMCPVDENLPGLEARRAEAVAALDDHFARKRERAAVRGERKPGVSFDEQFTGKEERFALMARDHYEANIAYLDLQTLIAEMKERYAEEIDLRPGEIGKVLENYFNYDYGEETRALMRELPWNVANHTCLDFPRLLRLGYEGIREQVRAARAERADKADFYEAMLLSLEAVSRFIHAYAQAARLAGKAEMARICDKIADQKPDTFPEAMELLWMTHLISNIDGGSAMSIARFDQYMRPFFERDWAAGTLTLGEAREYIASLWLKLNEPKMRTVQSCCLGGVTREGADGASLLTRLCLEITALLKLPYPNVSVRVDPDISPDWLLNEALRTIRVGGGMPMILNDKLWVENFVAIGLKIEDARDYYNMGCVEMLIQAKQPFWFGGGGVNLPELVLKQIEARKDCPGTFEEVLEAIVADIHAHLRGREGRIRASIARMETSCDPFASALVEGCIESGKDFFAGGTKLGPFVSFGCTGLGTATDSLCAIKKHVYEEKRLTLKRLSEALAADFVGYEDVRALLQSRPSYGNDDDGADAIAKRMFDAAMADILDYNKLDCRERFISSLFSYNSHISIGESLGATPDGRRRGEPISDNIGPVQGRDILGPTALLSSLLKLDLNGITGANAMNLKLNASLWKDEKGTLALKALVRAYLLARGPQLQINCVDAEELRRAQREPEKHRNLVVRIAGYCEYFVNLDRKLQGEIISRTMHEIA